MPSTNTDATRDHFQGFQVPRRSSNPHSNTTSSTLGHLHLAQVPGAQYLSHDTREVSFQHPPYPLHKHPHTSDFSTDASSISSSVHPHAFPPGIDPVHRDQRQRPQLQPQQQPHQYQLPQLQQQQQQQQQVEQRRRRISSSSSLGSKRLSISMSKSAGANSQGHQSSGPRIKATNTPHHTRRFTRLILDDEPDTTYLWGYLLFFCTMIGFVVSMYALVVSTYMPETKNQILDWIKHDSHYCMLVPVTLPVTILVVLFNWLGMKLFRHN